MRKTIVQISCGIIGIALIVLLVQLALATRPVAGETAAQTAPTDPVVEALQARLDELGVPVKEIRLVERSPLNVEVYLQGTSDTDWSSDEDRWVYFLAEREAELAYLNIGEGINQYRLVLYNVQGKIILEHTKYLNPEMFSQQLTQAGPAIIGDEETHQLILQEWNIGKNEWLSLQVETGHYARENTRYVYMEWSTGTDSFEVTKSRVQAFAGIPRQVKDFNTRHGAQIAIVRVKIFDPQGNVLAHYIYDNDIRMQIPRMPEGVEPEWLPRPAIDEPSNPEATETPIPTPTSLTIEPSLTPAPYP